MFNSSSGFSSPSPTCLEVEIYCLIEAIGSDSKGWLRHGMAIRLALDMGLNLDSATLERTHQFPEVEIKLRKQIYWSLYCTDKLWASYTVRVCTMLVGLPTSPRHSTPSKLDYGTDLVLGLPIFGGIAPVRDCV